MLGALMHEADGIHADYPVILTAPQMSLVEPGRPNGHRLTFQQAGNALLIFGLAALAAWAGGGIVFGVGFWLGVGRDEAFVVAQHRLARSLTDQVLRANRNLAAAAGSV